MESKKYRRFKFSLEALGFKFLELTSRESHVTSWLNFLEFKNQDSEKNIGETRDVPLKKSKLSRGRPHRSKPVLSEVEVLQAAARKHGFDAQVFSDDGNITWIKENSDKRSNFTFNFASVSNGKLILLEHQSFRFPATCYSKLCDRQDTQEIINNFGAIRIPRDNLALTDLSETNKLPNTINHSNYSHSSKSPPSSDIIGNVRNSQEIEEKELTEEFSKRQSQKEETLPPPSIWVYCRFCLYKGSTEGSVLRHENVTHSKLVLQGSALDCLEQYTCSICQTTASNRVSFALHIRDCVDSEHEEIVCALCGFKSYTYMDWLLHNHKHQLYVTNSSQPSDHKQYKCPICKDKYGNFELMTKHLKFCAGGEKTEDGYTCFECNKVFQDYRQLIEHRHLSHFAFTTFDSSSNNFHSNKVQCHRCKNIFNNIKDMFRHFKSCTLDYIIPNRVIDLCIICSSGAFEIDYPCYFCRINFEDPIKVREHETSCVDNFHIIRRYKCDKCNYTNMEILQVVTHYKESHVSINVNEKKDERSANTTEFGEKGRGLSKLIPSFPCSVCPATTHTRIELVQHVKQNHPGSNFNLNRFITLTRESQHIQICMTHNKDESKMSAISPEFFCVYCHAGYNSIALARMHSRVCQFKSKKISNKK